MSTEREIDIYRQVAQLHLDGLSGGFLAKLGPGFLALMYEAIDRAPGSVLLVEVSGDRVVGFVSGGRGMGPIYRQMLHRPFALARSLLTLLLRPSHILQILEILRYGRNKDANAGLPESELLSIVVALDMRGRGVAERLYRRLVGHFEAEGVRAFRITVGGELARAHAFYNKMGARPVAEIEVHAGERSVVYAHDISCDDRDALR
jgi:ribosomal protein S18 acetylase RimI-like enzyme